MYSTLLLSSALCLFVSFFLHFVLSFLLSSLISSYLSSFLNFIFSLLSWFYFPSLSPFLLYTFLCCSSWSILHKFCRWSGLIQTKLYHSETLNECGLEHRRKIRTRRKRRKSRRWSRIILWWKSGRRSRIILWWKSRRRSRIILWWKSRRRSRIIILW
jgi:hypothetical protein